MCKRLYAKKTEDGKLDIFDEKFVRLDGRTYFSPNERIMRRLGYKPLIISPSPKLNEGDHLTVKYVDLGDRIETKYIISGDNV